MLCEYWLIFFFPWEISPCDGSLADTKEPSSAGVWSDYREGSHGYNCWDEEFTSSGGSGPDLLFICICASHRHIILTSVQAGVVSKVENIVLSWARGLLSARFTSDNVQVSAVFCGFFPHCDTQILTAASVKLDGVGIMGYWIFLSCCDCRLVGAVWTDCCWCTALFDL